MRSVVTAKIKIPTSTDIVRTIKAFARMKQYCINQAWKRGIKNNVKLHPFVYERIRTVLPAQLAASCIKQACAVVKKAKSKPIVTRASVGYNFPRSARLKGTVLEFRALKNIIKVPLKIPDCFREYFNSWRVRESLLRIDKKGRTFFYFTFSREVDARDDASQPILGIDLGVNNLAVTSDGGFYNQGQVKSMKRKYKYLRSVLQAKGTRASKRLLRRLSGRENRYMAWVNHNISKRIVASFDGGRIVMEDLKGVRKQHRGRRMNYWIHNWSFFQLQRFITYKAEKVGIKVERVKPHFTSQLCHKCGVLGSRLKGCFSCVHCGLSSYSADLNAARNLASPMLAARQALVNVPYSTCDDTKALPRSDLRLSIVESLAS